MAGPLHPPVEFAVYAKGEAEPVEYVVPGAGKRLEVFAVDLAGSIEDIHATIDRLAQRVRLLRSEALGAALAA